MGRYFTPLPGLLAEVVGFVLARAAALDAQAAARLEPLEGRWMKFEVEGLRLDLWLGVVDAGFVVRAEREPDAHADASVSGNPGALLGMAVPALEGGSVRIEGDARLAQKFQHALKALDPDLEQGLSAYFGDLLGPQLYRVLIETVALSRHGAATGEAQVARWLGEESGLVPGRGEWHAFRDGVDELREAVDRLERRVARRAREASA